MESTRKAKPTAADIRAAGRLMAVWKANARRLGITQDTLAAELDITQGAVSQYLNGKIPMNYRTLVVFCRALGIEPDEIRTDLPEQQLMTAPSVDAGWTDVVGYAQAAALGDGSIPEDYAETHALKFKRSSLSRKGLKADRLAVYYGDGDSMEPTIETGDAILFDTSDTRLQDGKIFMVRYDGHITAKRMVKLGRAWFLSSDNATDPKWRKPVPVDETRDFEVIGRVRWIAGWED